MSKHVVYLLCFDGELVHDHYVGITTPGRLRKRMMEHRSGKGGKATQEARLVGRAWSLVRLYPTDDPALEQRLQRHPDLASECPHCAHGLTGEPQIPYTRATLVIAGLDLLSFPDK